MLVFIIFYVFIIYLVIVLQDFISEVYVGGIDFIDYFMYIDGMLIMYLFLVNIVQNEEMIYLN